MTQADFTNFLDPEGENKKPLTESLDPPAVTEEEEEETVETGAEGLQQLTEGAAVEPQDTPPPVPEPVEIMSEPDPVELPTPVQPKPEAKPEPEPEAVEVELDEHTYFFANEDLLARINAGDEIEDYQRVVPEWFEMSQDFVDTVSRLRRLHEALMQNDDNYAKQVSRELESTDYVSATREMVLRQLAASKGLSGKDFELALRFAQYGDTPIMGEEGDEYRNNNALLRGLEDGLDSVYTTFRYALPGLVQEGLESGEGESELMVMQSRNMVGAAYDPYARRSMYRGEGSEEEGSLGEAIGYNIGMAFPDLAMMLVPGGIAGRIAKKGAKEAAEGLALKAGSRLNKKIAASVEKRITKEFGGEVTDKVRDDLIIEQTEKMVAKEVRRRIATSSAAAASPFGYARNTGESAGLNQSENFEAEFKDGEMSITSDVDLGLVLGAGAAKTAVDYVPIGRLLGRSQVDEYGRTAAETAVYQSLKRSFNREGTQTATAIYRREQAKELARMFGRVAGDMRAEGMTEGLQTLIDQGMISGELDGVEIMNAVLAGGVGMTSVSGGQNVVSTSASVRNLDQRIRQQQRIAVASTHLANAADNGDRGLGIGYHEHTATGDQAAPVASGKLQLVKAGSQSAALMSQEELDTLSDDQLSGMGVVSMGNAFLVFDPNSGVDIQQVLAHGDTGRLGAFTGNVMGMDAKALEGSTDGLSGVAIVDADGNVVKVMVTDGRHDQNALLDNASLQAKLAGNMGVALLDGNQVLETMTGGTLRLDPGDIINSFDAAPVEAGLGGVDVTIEAQEAQLEASLKREAGKDGIVEIIPSENLTPEQQGIVEAGNKLGRKVVFYTALDGEGNEVAIEGAAVSGGTDVIGIDANQDGRTLGWLDTLKHENVHHLAKENPLLWGELAARMSQARATGEVGKRKGLNIIALAEQLYAGDQAKINQVQVQLRRGEIDEVLNSITAELEQERLEAQTAPDSEQRRLALQRIGEIERAVNLFVDENLADRGARVGSQAGIDSVLNPNASLGQQVADRFRRLLTRAGFRGREAQLWLAALEAQIDKKPIESVPIFREDGTVEKANAKEASDVVLAGGPGTPMEQVSPVNVDELAKEQVVALASDPEAAKQMYGDLPGLQQMLDKEVARRLEEEVGSPEDIDEQVKAVADKTPENHRSEAQRQIGRARKRHHRGRMIGDAESDARFSRGVNNGTNSDLRDLAAKYNELNGLPEIDTSIRPFDEQRHIRLGQAMHDAAHEPGNPDVMAAYAAFKEETRAQYDMLIDAGYNFIAHSTPGREPYQPPAEGDTDRRSPSRKMRDQVEEEKTLVFYPTIQPGAESFGNTDEQANDHPLLEPTGRMVQTDSGEVYEMTDNDVFRVVHDVFGHAKEGSTFGTYGEEHAAWQHSQMYTDEALPALIAESRMQNAFVNYGPHMLRPDGTVPSRNDPDFVPQSERPFADQKVFIPPAEAMRFSKRNRERHLSRIDEALGRQASYLTEEEKMAMQGPAAAAKVVERIGTMAGQPLLERAAEMGLPMMKWYTAASITISEAAKGMGVPSWQLAGVLSATSPSKSVADSVDLTLTVFERWTAAGRPTDPTKIEQALTDPETGESILYLGADVNNTISVLSSTTREESEQRFSGLKVSAFHKALMNELGEVVNDSLMARAFGIDKNKMTNATEYRAGTIITRRVAERLGIHPSEAQAALWVISRVTGERVSTARKQQREALEKGKAPTRGVRSISQQELAKEDIYRGDDIANLMSGRTRTLISGETRSFAPRLAALGVDVEAVDAKLSEFEADNPGLTPEGWTERSLDAGMGRNTARQFVRNIDTSFMLEGNEGPSLRASRRTDVERANGLFRDEAIEQARRDHNNPNARLGLVYMSPEDYLALAKHIDKDQLDADTLRDLRRAIRNSIATDTGTLTDIPHLSFAETAVDENRISMAVVGHEGRHRAYAMKAEGISLMPVVYRLGETLRGTFTDDGNFNDKDTGRVMLPYSVTNEDGNEVVMPKPEPADLKARLKYEPRSSAFLNSYKGQPSRQTGDPDQDVPFEQVQIPTATTQNMFFIYSDRLGPDGQQFIQGSPMGMPQDPLGRQLILFHGGYVKGEQEGNPLIASEHGAAGPGIYTTPDFGVARGYEPHGSTYDAGGIAPMVFNPTGIIIHSGFGPAAMDADTGIPIFNPVAMGPDMSLAQSMNDKHRAIATDGRTTDVRADAHTIQLKDVLGSDLKGLDSDSFGDGFGPVVIMTGLKSINRSLQDVTLSLDALKADQRDQNLPTHTPIGYQIGKGKIRIHFMVREDGGLELDGTSVIQKAELLGVDPRNTRHGVARMHDLSKASVVSVDIETSTPLGGRFDLSTSSPSVIAAFEKLNMPVPPRLAKQDPAKVDFLVDDWKEASQKAIARVARQIKENVEDLASVTEVIAKNTMTYTMEDSRAKVSEMVVDSYAGNIYPYFANEAGVGAELTVAEANEVGIAGKKYIYAGSVAFAITEIGSLRSAMPGVAQFGDADVRTPYEGNPSQSFDIRASVRSNPETGNMRFDNDLGTRARRWFVDKLVDLRDAVDLASERTGRPVPRDRDVYAGARLQNQRVAERINDYSENTVKPIMQLMAEEQIQEEEMEEFLYARHAQERNAEIARRGGPKDGGSGMTNAESQAILNNIAADPRSMAFEELGGLFDNINHENLDLLYENGLITLNELEILGNTYPHYVPLQGVSDDILHQLDMELGGIVGGKTLGGVGVGRKIVGASGSGMRAAHGRQGRARNVLMNALMRRADVAARLEKNRTGNRLVRLSNMLQEPEMFEVLTKLPTVRRLRNGKEFTEPDQSFKQREDVMTVYLDKDTKINGVQKKKGDAVYVHVKSAPLAKVLNRAYDPNGSAMDHTMAVLASLNSYYRMVITQLDPEFMLRNAARDVQTAVIAQTGEKGQGLATLKNVPKAFQTALAYAFGRKGPLHKEYEEMIRAGGRQVMYASLNEESLAKAMKKARRLARGKTARTPFMKPFDIILQVGEAFENASRLATYVAMKESGANNEQAALRARDVTVDFSRKGTIGAALNQMYLFFNASAQGASRSAGLLTTGRGRKVAMGIAGLGMMQGFLNAFFDEEDEETGMMTMDLVPDHEKRAYHVMKIPMTDDYMRLPLPYGYHLFHGVGRTTAEVLLGNMTLAEAAGEVALMAAEAYNPMAGSGITANPAVSLTPQVGKLPMEIATNTNFAGNKIYADSPFQKGPKSQQGFSTTPDTYKDLAAFLNEVSGGDEFESGQLDVQPEIYKQAFEHFFGGVGRTTQRTVGLAEAATDPNYRERVGFSREDIPFLRTVAGTTSAKDRGMMYREVLEEAQTIVQIQRDAEKAGAGEKITEIQQRDPGLYNVAFVIQGFDGEIRKIRRSMRAAENAGGLPKDQELEFVEQIRGLQNKAIAAYAEYLYDKRDAQPSALLRPLMQRLRGDEKKNNYGTRVDGTPKGEGFLGRVDGPDSEPMTEISIQFDDVLDGKPIPTLVPTLTSEEIAYLRKHGTGYMDSTEDPEMVESIQRKAIDHARERDSKGLSPFAD